MWVAWGYSWNVSWGPSWYNTGEGRVSFRVPEFNLSVNIWRWGTGVSNPPDVTAQGNLSPGRRVFTGASFTEVAASNPPMFMELMLPAGTDVRYSPLSPGISGDMVEVPAGTGRYYYVCQVDDVAKGFSNEYRLALMLPAMGSVWEATTTENGNEVWPVPYP
jgi:hypothetical protein